MARKFFGTDGIRGRTNEGVITAELSMKVGQAAGTHFLRGGHRHRVVIGKDTRLSGYMVESALVAHPSVVEAAVVGMPHEIKGTGIAAFVTLGPGFEEGDDLKKALREHVGTEIGAIAKPDQIRFTAALPKTRSGKIMRRLLRDIAAGRESNQDTTTLEDLSVLARLRESDGE